MFGFFYAVFGALCVYWLVSCAKKRGGRPALITWIALFAWYAAVGQGLSFTIINYAGNHSQAALVGCIGTVVVAVALGFVVFRLANLKVSPRR